VVLGAAAVLVGLGAGVGGGALVWAHATQRDADGFYTTSRTHFATDSAALTSGNIDLGADPTGHGWSPGSLGSVTVRLQATTAPAHKPLFMGIGREDDVAAYLAGAAHDEVTDANFSNGHVTYHHVAGDVRPAPPASRPIWAATATGDGIQTLSWPAQSGRWDVVVMNADGSPGVDLDLVVAGKTGLLLPIGLGLGAFGLVALGIGAALIVAGASGSGTGPGPETPANPTSPAPGVHVRA
jgi:hypothetical protein